MTVAGNIKYQDPTRVYYKNETGGVLPVRSVVVIGDRVGITNTVLADDEVGVAHIARTWPMPVNATINSTAAAGDVLYWDAVDGELNDDAVNNPRAGIVEIDSAGELCSTAGHQFIMLNA